MPGPAADMARQLARHAEAVCRRYLSNGFRAGRYWHVGDIANTPGQSLYVRLAGPSAGKWTDAATGEHGDLLDLIALNRNLPLNDALAEARQFLALPQPQQHAVPRHRARSTPEAARRLFAMARPISGTIAETYLRARGITGVCHLTALRFHPNCFYRAHNGTTRNGGPALIAAVTDLQGRITGVQRTWLDVTGRGKAPVSTPRKALGHLLGNGVRFGNARDVLLAGEGIETVLSLKMVLGAMPMVAALSASHLAALVLPSLKRLYIACDADRAGRRACERLAERAGGAVVLALHPRGGDFNDDLRAYGADALKATLRVQMAPDDLPGADAMPAGESEGA
ncbi:MAG: toprim domain-containing protein [Hyphomicrobiaceae bacterium]